MSETDSKVSRKGFTRANQMRTTKTQAVLFFIDCLNDLSNLFKLMSLLETDNIEAFKSHAVVEAFVRLPHSPTDFTGSFNSYRAKLVLKSLGMNINPSHLKKFSQASQTLARSQNRKHCRHIVKTVEDHKEQYREVLALFIGCFVERLKERWQREDALLKSQEDAKADEVVIKKSLTEVFDELVLAQLSTEVAGIDDLSDKVDTTMSGYSVFQASMSELPSSAILVGDSVVADATLMANASVPLENLPAVVIAPTSEKTVFSSTDNNTEKASEQLLEQPSTNLDAFEEAVKQNPRLQAMFDISNWLPSPDENVKSSQSDSPTVNNQAKSQQATPNPIAASSMPNSTQKAPTLIVNNTEKVSKQLLEQPSTNLDAFEEAVKQNPRLQAVFDISNWR